MTKDYQIYIKDILKAMDDVAVFVHGMSFEEFLKDDKTSSAVIRKFEIMGEAAKQVPEEIRMKYPAIPWKEMAGMRDRLIHFYSGIDYRLVWESIQNRLPKVREQLRKI